MNPGNARYKWCKICIIPTVLGVICVIYRFDRSKPVFTAKISVKTPLIDTIKSDSYYHVRVNNGYITRAKEVTLTFRSKLVSIDSPCHWFHFDNGCTVKSDTLMIVGVEYDVSFCWDKGDKQRMVMATPTTPSLTTPSLTTPSLTTPSLTTNTTDMSESSTLYTCCRIHEREVQSGLSHLVLYKGTVNTPICTVELSLYTPLYTLFKGREGRDSYYNVTISDCTVIELEVVQPNFKAKLLNKVHIGDPRCDGSRWHGLLFEGREEYVKSEPYSNVSIGCTYAVRFYYDNEDHPCVYKIYDYNLVQIL